MAVHDNISPVTPVRELYPYQEEAIERIFATFTRMKFGKNILFQLPTGGGKTVIFSEITRRYIAQHGKKVLILTHRIELSRQIARTLESTGVSNKVIDSTVWQLDDQEQHQCFVAMVETLNNRLSDNRNYIGDIGLVIVDEAHYNSFRKIFHYFDEVTILGVTATPLSSNRQLPLNDNYHHLITGQSISDLIREQYLSDATTYSFDVNTRSLRVGITGDFTVSSSERLYSSPQMIERLLQAYEEKARGSKTLIFNSGIETSRLVGNAFEKAGYPVRHLDSTFSSNDRQEVIRWFRATKDGILTSVGILTHGFDEPDVDTIILNRATRSITLYHQMIGRGSRKTPKKNHFNIIDLGNNALRLGLWQDPIDWHFAFKYPEIFIEQSIREAEPEPEALYYEMPPDLLARFSNRLDLLEFEMPVAYQYALKSGRKANEAIDLSLANHVDLIASNANSYDEALELAGLLKEEIMYRLRQYVACLTKATDSYLHWLVQRYQRKLRHQLLIKMSME
ncbi:MAG: DEAD/DEAH box helicase [Bacteroidota bacterium]